MQKKQKQDKVRELEEIEDHLLGFGISLKQAIGRCKSLHKNSKKQVTYPGAIKPDEEIVLENDPILGNLYLEKLEKDREIIKRIDYLLGR